MSKELNKTSVVSECDILKGIGALGLPFVHTVETFLLCDLTNAGDSAFCRAVLALTVFGPSVFMICMGMRLVRIHDSHSLLRYGRILFSTGLLLNLIRSIVPSLLVLLVRGSKADYLLSFLFLSDIYLFAGLFYTLLGGLRKIRLPLTGIAVVSLGLFAAGFLFAGSMRTESETINAIIGNLIYVDEGSVFPLLSWTVFPVFGMLAGKLTEHKSRAETDRLCLRVLPIALAILLLTSAILYKTGRDPISIAVSPLNEYRTDPANVILVLCINVIAIIVVRFTAYAIRAEKPKQWLNWLSANLMVFYFVHWCILALVCYGVAAILDLNGTTAGAGLMMLLAAAVDAATVLIVKKCGFIIMKSILKAVRA